MTAGDQTMQNQHDPHDAHEHLVDDGFGCASPEETLAATRSGAACAWWQLTVFLEVKGPDAITFLDAVSSQDIAAIPEGSGQQALFLTPKAHIVAPVIAWRVAADHVLLELDPRVSESLQAHLLRYRLRAKVEITPVNLGCATLVGQGAEALAQRFAGEPDTDPGELGAWYSSPAWGLPARTFIGSLAATHAVVSQLEERALAPMADPETLDALRIVAGVPALGDLLLDHMPAEVGGVDIAVSLTKGCYLGQEPVARLHWRGKANRVLRQVELDREIADEEDLDELVLVQADQASDPDATHLGVVTSWARQPEGAYVGLAVVRSKLGVSSLLKIAGTDVSVRIIKG